MFDIPPIVQGGQQLAAPAQGLRGYAQGHRAAHSHAARAHRYEEYADRDDPSYASATKAAREHAVAPVRGLPYGYDLRNNDHAGQEIVQGTAHTYGAIGHGHAPAHGQTSGLFHKIAIGRLQVQDPVQGEYMILLKSVLGRCRDSRSPDRGTLE